MRIFALICATALLPAGMAEAQSYRADPGTSPLSLLDVPKDALAYHALVDQAQVLIDAGKFAEAVPVLEERVRLYPRDPENWRVLAILRSHSGDHAGAAAAYEEAGKLWGWDIGQSNGYRAAASHLKSGNKARAMELLHWLIEERHGYLRESLYDWPDFKALRDDPEFLALIGRVDTTGWTRERGWRYDIDWLRSEIKRVNPDYRDTPFPASFTAKAEELKRNIPHLTDEQIFVGMGEMLAILHQGHLVLWADEGARTPNRFLPLRLYAFPEGVFVIGADDTHRSLIGSKVVKFGDVPAEEALRRLATAGSVDGDMQHLWRVSYLTQTYYLRGMGLANDARTIDLVLKKGSAPLEKVSVSTLPREMEGRQDKLIAPPDVAPPLFLADPNVPFRVEPLPGADALYVQVNNLKNAENQKLKDFGDRLWARLDQEKQRNLILDLRHNNGGTTQLYPSLLRTITSFSRVEGNQVYALIGRRTYSAAGNFVTDLERLADPVFVGEASSECCNLYGDPTLVRLPYSNVMGELTAVKWQLSEPGDRRREINPRIPVQLTAEAYFEGRDPALATILKLVKSQPAQ